MIVHHGDCLDVLKTLPANSVDAVVTDPPYGISFMGREWDQPGQFGSRRGDGKPRGGHPNSRQAHDAMAAGSYDLSPSALRNFQLWCERWSFECRRVLQPGGYLVSFGGSRTWHRLAAGIEDAGFEMRDSIAWLYGSGFPKSLDVSKALDKAAGAEREVIGTKHGQPGYSLTDGNGDHRTYGKGLGNTGSGEAECAVTAPATSEAREWSGWGTALKPAFEPIVVARKPFAGTVAQNVVEYGTGALNIDGCRVPGDNSATINRRKGSTAFLSDRSAREAESSGRMESRTSPERYREERPGELIGRWPTNVVLDENQATELDQQSGTLSSGSRRPGQYGLMGYHGAGSAPMPAVDGDSGGASRFFPVFRYEAKAPGSERPSVDGAAHPTVKPLDLMRWLVRLVTPPNGLVLDPFAGSGTTAEACIHEHMRCITIEREAEYLPLITARLSKPMAIGFDFG
ncbi:DNA methylase [Mycolicibacterium canariasense]|nr:DNA methylase [Mycolicibacterium canariasense]